MIAGLKPVQLPQRLIHLLGINVLDPPSSFHPPSRVYAPPITTRGDQTDALGGITAIVLAADLLSPRCATTLVCAVFASLGSTWSRVRQRILTIVLLITLE